MSQILVVDDDYSILMFVRSILEKHFHQVYTASSGSDAIDIVKRISFDLAITDLKMPVMPGDALIQGIKKLKKRFPIILTTDSIVPSNSRANKVLIKPLDEKDLIAHVERLLA